MIKQCVQLTENETAEVVDLLKVCRDADHVPVIMQMNKNLNFHKEMNSWFLSYSENTLVGAVSAFGPLNHEIEWTGCVDPSYRRTGIFTALMTCADEEANRHGIERRLFALERKSESGQGVMKKKGYPLVQTEYSMVLPGDAEISRHKANLHIMRSGFGELEEMAQLSAAAFEEPLEASRSMLVNSLKSKEREQYSAYKEDRMIGTVSLYINEGVAMINGLAIKPQEQGKGHGADFLAQLIRMLSRRELSITLDVSSENQAAYSLYRRMGFKETDITDYFEQKISSPSR